MFETTKLKPVYNGYQYLFIFLVAVVFDLIIHFFSSRKYNALKAGTDAIGFVPELAVYYRSLCRRGPFPTDSGPESFYSGCNSWLMGAIIAGSVAIFILLFTDLILQAIDYRNTV
jgi:hypothetical protein